MMKQKFMKRSISMLLTLLIAISGVVPAMSAFAADGVEGYYDLQIFYDETDTIVPTNGDDGVSEYIEYMHEGDTLQLKYKLIDSVWPDNGYVTWSSANPVLVDVDNTGKVKAFDASKGAVIQAWIDNEVKTIPLVGSLLGKAVEKIFFNEYVDLDTMDTEAIVDLFIAGFGSDSILAKYIEAYQGQLVDSLRKYLDNINTAISCKLFDKDGNLLAEDIVKVTVLKSEEWYSAFLPNGTHITNKASIQTTQAVGNKVQLYAITTPQRLGFGTVYSVKSSSVFQNGKVVATVDDSGLVTFKNKGTVTIVVSPDSEQVIQKILELVNYFYKINTEMIDSDKLAEILIKYVGIDMNRAVLAALLDACFAIYDIAQGVADPVKLTASAAKIIANIVLQMTYNDSITFNVVDAQPITNFDIEGATTVKEGTQIALAITNVQPEAGDVSDITWKSSDPTVACVDEKTGLITGLDAGGSLGNLSSQTCEITATSAANNVSKTVTITVTGKTGKYISSVFIEGADTVELNSETDYTYSIYPKRVAEADNLHMTWGMLTGEDEEGNPVYTWADSETPATDGRGQIDSNGHYKALEGGRSTIVLKAVTGYQLSNGSFYEISSFIATKDVSTGIPVENIRITATGGTSNGKLNRDEIVTVNGVDYEYVTIHKNVAEGYMGNGAKFSAEVFPANASDQTLTWVVDNNYYEKSDMSDDTHSISVKQKSGHEVADTFNIYAVSSDGKIRSNTVTVCVTRNYVKSTAIDQNNIEIINGKTFDVSHTPKFDGSWTGEAYACYKANWYSSDEDVFSVQSKGDSKGSGVITANDVGTATLYCYTADGGFFDTRTVVVKPDKTYLKEIVDLCDNASIARTKENKALYQQYMKQLDLAYTVLYDQDMASQTVCDTYAQNLLLAFYKIGGFVGIGSVKITGKNKTELKSDYVSVKVSSVGDYRKYSYDFDYIVNPKTAMFSDVKWTSSNSAVKVDENGKCTPVSNDPCSAVITCTITDYMGDSVSDSVRVAFAKVPATGVTLNKTEIVGGKVGETETLTAKVLPNSVVVTNDASCKEVEWKSTDESVATVDKNGVITFVYGGDCEIVCTTLDGGHSASCKVNVVTNYDKLQLLINQYNDLQLNRINFYPDTYEVYEKAMEKAQTLIEKHSSSQKQVDAMYAELEAAYKQLKKYNYIQNVELYLDGEQTQEFYQYDLSLLKEGVSYKNAVLDLNVRLYPNNASYSHVKWESSTSDISVTTDGKCSPTANKCCYGQITCTVYDHFGGEFKDSVWVSYSFTPVTKLELNDDNINGKVGDTHQLLCTVFPEGVGIDPYKVGAASIQDYFWESDNEKVATVNETGLVTFVSAGATVIRAVSYDGGIFVECTVSTEGDRSALKAALEKYAAVDTGDYEYSYVQAFKVAYRDAENVMDNLSSTQDDIDEAAANLNAAGEAMTGHPYIKVEKIDLAYKTIKRQALLSPKQIASGSIGDNDAVSINLSSNYNNTNNYNDIVIDAAVLPASAMYKSISWTVDESKDMKASDVTDTSITLTPTERNSGGWAKITISAVDHYDRITSRTVYVTMSDKTATGIDIANSEMTLSGNDSNVTIAYTVQGSPEFSSVIWSSSDESVVRVENGALVPVDKGTAVVTGKTLDGGHMDVIRVTVYTDFGILAEKVNNCTNLINESTGKHIYTQDSLDALGVVTSEAKTMVDDGRATQKEVNEMLDRLNQAYDALVEYVKATGVTISAQAADNVTAENEGYIRYEGTTLNQKTIQLEYTLLPKDYAVCKSIEWSSSNSNVSVDRFGLVTNETGTSKYAVITCTVTNEFDEVYTGSVVVSFVRYGVKAVTFDSDVIYGAPQEVKKLTPNLNQESTLISSSYISDCIYSSSDESIATVDEQGNVTFISQGTAVITVTALDGGYQGTINAYTTWDTTALQEAIAQAKTITYTDYAYEQGMALVNALDTAEKVYADIYASQAEIDEACANLTTAITNLEGHDFIKPEITVSIQDKAVQNNASYEIDENAQVIVKASVNADAMIQSGTWSTENANGVTASTDANNNLVLTKTAENDGSVTVIYTAVDDYGREYKKEYSIKVVNAIVNITNINITVDGTETTDTKYSSTGHKYGYIGFNGIQLGYVAYPENATEAVKVSWSSSAASYVTVSNTGLVNLTTSGKLRSTNTATITCTVENADGSTVSKTISITIAR